jgi:hypothetical protein
MVYSAAFITHTAFIIYQKLNTAMTVIVSMVESNPALLTKTEIQWLLGNAPVSKGYERKIRYSINRKIATLTKLELPLLASRGFNVTANCNGVTTGSNTPRGLQAAAGCGIGNQSTTREKRGEWDSNPRVLSDMGLAIPRPTRLGDPRPHLKQLQLTLY